MKELIKKNLNTSDFEAGLFSVHWLLYEFLIIFIWITSNIPQTYIGIYIPRHLMNLNLYIDILINIVLFI